LLRIGQWFLAALLVANLAGASSTMAQSDGTEPAATADTGQRRVERPGRTGLPLPRFVSLRASEVNLRTGPGVRYPIEWVYRRRNMPVEIIDEFETWRRIRDWEGTVGWVHQSMLQGRRTLRVTGEMRVVRRSPDPSASPVVRLEPGVLGRLESCEEVWCEVEIAGFSGWLRRDEFYGLLEGERLR
jgi:SH3-like domain-containing protein